MKKFSADAISGAGAAAACLAALLRLFSFPFAALPRFRLLLPATARALLFFCFSALWLPLYAFAEDADLEFTVRRPFGGQVRRDMAERALRIAAEQEAMDRAVLLLAREKSFLPGALPGAKSGAPRAGQTPGGLADFPLDGLARLVFTTKTLGVDLEGFPPSVQTAARLRLEAPRDMRAALQKALERPDLMEIHSRALAEGRRLLAAYDALAVKLLTRNPATDGGMLELHKLQRISHEMSAMEIFTGLLPQLGAQWDDPEAARRELTRAMNLAPGNALIKTALAEALLQLDRPVPALEQAGEAVKSAPDYARAHDVRGTILLRQRLFSLAVESFGRAVALSPHNAAYLTHRAAAYLVLGDEQGMCADFISACGMGDCEGLEWARGAGKCTVKGIEAE